MKDNIYYVILINFRRAVKQKLFSLLNFGGLVVGFSLIITLILIIEGELGYDRLFNDASRIYRITTIVDIEGEITHYAPSPRALAPAVIEDIPEVNHITRFIPKHNVNMDYNDEAFLVDNIFIADTGFFDLFDFEFEFGDKDNFQESDEIVLSASFAKVVFGDKNPVGETISLSDYLDMEVVGVLKEPVNKTHLNFDAVVSWYSWDLTENWDDLDSYTYAKVHEKSSKIDFDTKLTNLTQNHLTRIGDDYNASVSLVTQNIQNIHLQSSLDEEISNNSSIIYVYIFVSLLAFITLIISVNYINFTITSSVKRLKEIAVRKVLGAGSNEIKVQIFLESLLNTTLAFIMAFFLLWVNLSWVSELLGTKLTIGLEHLSTILLTHLLLCLTISLCVTAYIAKLLSKSTVQTLLLNRVEVTKSKISTRKLLLGGQLGISIIMLIALFTIKNQINYLSEVDLGFNKKNLISVKVPESMNYAGESFKQKISNLSVVDTVSSSSYNPKALEYKDLFNVQTSSGRVDKILAYMYCDINYIKSLGIELYEGRMFDANNQSDYKNTFLVNRTAVKEFGLKIGSEIRGPLGPNGTSERAGGVIGILEDFNYQSLKTKIEPLVIMLSKDGQSNQYVYIRLNNSDYHTSIKQIEELHATVFDDLVFEYELIEDTYNSLYASEYQLEKIVVNGLIVIMLITIIGVFALSSYDAAQQTKANGVRRVFGASRRQILLIHLNRFTKLVIISSIAAWPLAYILVNFWLGEFEYKPGVNISAFLYSSLIIFFFVILAAVTHAIQSALAKITTTLRYG